MRGRNVSRAKKCHNSSSIQRTPDQQMDRMIEAMTGRRGRTLRRGKRGNSYLKGKEIGWTCKCGRHHKRYGTTNDNSSSHRIEAINICPLCLDTATKSLRRSTQVLAFGS